MADAKKCGACKETLPLEKYSKSQWQAKASVRRCLVCVSSDRPTTAPQTAEEKRERDDFVAACIAALRQRDDVEDHTLDPPAIPDIVDEGQPAEDTPKPQMAAAPKKATKKKKKKKEIVLPRVDPAAVLRALCFDYPDADAADLDALAAALRDDAWRMKHRFPVRAIAGVRYLAAERRAEGPALALGRAAANLCLALSVSCGRFLLEADRPRAIRFAARPAAPPRSRTPTEAKIAAALDARKKITFDSSRWDDLDSGSGSDSDGGAVEEDDIFAAPPCGNVGECARYAALIGECADYGTLAAAAWSGDDVADVVACARLFRDGAATSWLLRPRDPPDAAVAALIRENYARYVFLARDAFADKAALRRPIADGIVDLALARRTGSGGAASAVDGGVALVALGSLAADPDLLGDGDATRVLRDAARRSLPALADLARALGGRRSADRDDAALLGALLALVERAAGVVTARPKTPTDDLSLGTSFDARRGPRRKQSPVERPVRASVSLKSNSFSMILDKVDPNLPEFSTTEKKLLGTFVPKALELEGIF